MNPDKQCNFDCAYCEVNRGSPATESRLDVDAMAEELAETLTLVRSGGLRERPCYRNLPADLMQLHHVALSGDGEPTQCPNFTEAVQAVMHVRARGQFSFFKIVLLTNGSGLDLPAVQNGLQCFNRHDEIWAKLDAGTQAYMDRINRPQVSLDKILANILLVARQRQVVIQSLFPAINGQEPPPEEIEAYAQRLKQLKEAGAQIPLVQIYSATRPTPRSDCGHLPLKTLSRIARHVREATGLKAEVF